MEIRRLLFSGLLLLSFITTSFGIKIVTQDSGGNPWGCIENVSVKVVVANLTDHINENYVLPDGYPNIEVHYTYGNQTDTELLTTFNPIGNSGAPHFIPLFATYVSITLDKTKYCEIGEMCEQEIPWIIELRQANGSYYPVHDYNVIGDIFTCQLFDLTFCACNVGCESYPMNPPYYSGNHPIDCSTCVSGCDRESDDFSNLNVKTQISPNPFTSDFVFETELEDAADIELTILDTHGKAIKSVRDQASEGIYRKRIFTEDWPSGIYFVNVKTGKQSQTHRIVKME